MSIFHNGKEYGATKVINYSAAPDYNKGVSVTNIQDGNYQATDNGFIVITLQSQQSNVTKVSIVRSKKPITDNEGMEIASRVIQQFQYSETLIVQVMAREYYKLLIDGVGNPQIISCVFYPYSSTVPIKLTEKIGVEQIDGVFGLDNGGTGVTTIEELQQLTIPVGFIYIQLRGQSTPDELFGSSGKWQDISSTYAGEFFRAVGGNSASFGTTQAEGLPNITGYATSIVGLFNYTTGAFSATSKYQDRAQNTPDNNYSNEINFNASWSNSIYGASTHVTPYNSAIRIWKKIA